MRKKWSRIFLSLNEAKVGNMTNTYALHEICFLPTAPIDIVKDIYYVYLKAAIQKDNNEDTPMSVAVYVRFEAVV